MTFKVFVYMIIYPKDITKEKNTIVKSACWESYIL